MKFNQLCMRVITLLLVASHILSLTACDDDDDGVSVGVGSVAGIVTDGNSNPLSGVAINIEGTELTATTDANGAYTFSAVSKEKHLLTYKKQSYQTISVTITPKSFVGNSATVNASMEYAAASITGIVLDAKNENAPLKGVEVSISETQKSETDAEGRFTIQNLPIDDYTLTFKYGEYDNIVKVVASSLFVNGVATIDDIIMGGRQILPHLILDDILEGDHWYYNEYRGGRNAESYPHWDWSVDFLATFSIYGAWEEQNEGTTLQINNSDADRNNPADLDNFDSFTFGIKHITADNQIMTIQCRTHSTSADDPTIWGVQVIDLSEDDPSAVKLGDNRSLDLTDGSYSSEVFDLSAYVGKDIAIAIGTYRAKTGDYFKQFVLRRIAFNNVAVENGNWGWLQGTPINEELEGWALTQEMVRSTMPQNIYAFTGISNVDGNRDGYVDAYKTWGETNHVAARWSFVPLHKDTNPFTGEGFVIKTRGGGTPVNTTEPEAYFYSKFSIDDAHSKLVLRCRNFSSTNSTFFKLTAITNNMQVKHIAPTNVVANTWENAADGCISFMHEDGNKGNPDGYASFTFDLSEYKGQDVTLCLGVYKGTENNDENQLSIYSITLN